MNNELDLLNRYRLENDLTYAALAERIGMKMDAVYRLLTRKPNANMRDRTRYKIQRFLAEQDSTDGDIAS